MREKESTALTIDLVIENRDHFFIIGLIGGIASGKSTVAHFFEKLGAYVINADHLGHKALELPSVKEKLFASWGEKVFQDKEVNREALAKIVFQNQSDLKKLESIVHPSIMEQIQQNFQELVQKNKTIVVFDIAILDQLGIHADCDIVIFIEASENIRKKRSIENRGWSEGELEKRSKFQKSLEAKKKLAHCKINNNGILEEIEPQVQSIWENIPSTYKN